MRKYSIYQGKFQLSNMRSIFHVVSRYVSGCDTTGAVEPLSEHDGSGPSPDGRHGHRPALRLQLPGRRLHPGPPLLALPQAPVRNPRRRHAGTRAACMCLPSSSSRQGFVYIKAKATSLPEECIENPSNLMFILKSDKDQRINFLSRLLSLSVNEPLLTACLSHCTVEPLLYGHSIGRSPIQFGTWAHWCPLCYVLECILVFIKFIRRSALDGQLVNDPLDNMQKLFLPCTGGWPPV